MFHANFHPLMTRTYSIEISLCHINECGVKSRTIASNCKCGSLLYLYTDINHTYLLHMYIYAKLKRPRNKILAQSISLPYSHSW